MLFKKSPTCNQSGRKMPSRRKCCCGICPISTGTRLVCAGQISMAVIFLLATIFGYGGHHEANFLTDALLIAVIIHACLAFLCAALVFLALHFRRPWLLILEMVFLILAVLEYMAGSMIFEFYVLRDTLRWLTGATNCKEENLKCVPVPEWKRAHFDWWNACLVAVHLGAAMLTIWFFMVILKCYFYSKKKCKDERRRREKAAENLGMLGRSGGGLVAACGAGGGGASTAMHSRSTLTTSLTATTYDRSARDPDLLLRY